MNHISDELLIAYIDEDVSAETAGEISKHLEGCSECKVSFQQLSRFFSQLKASPSSEPSDLFVNQVMARIIPPATTSSSFSDAIREWLPQMVSTAFALLIIITQLQGIPVLEPELALSELSSEINGLSLEPEISSSSLVPDLELE